MTLFAPVYTLFLISVIIASLFVVFHIIRYSLKPSRIMPTVFIFVILMSILIVINIISFVSIPFDEITLFSGIGY